MVKSRGGGRRGGQRGVALILTLLVVVLLVGMLALAVAFVAERQQSVRRETRQIHLVALADGALAETLARLAQRPGYAGLAQRDYGPGTIESRITVSGRNRRRIEAKAVYRQWERRVEAEVLLSASGPVVIGWRVVRKTDSE